MFEFVQPGPPDPMFELKKLADEDHSPDKVDLGVGIYRNENGLYHELEVVKKAKTILDQKRLGHDYELTTGNAEFLGKAAQVIFGADSEVLRGQRVSSVQTISGTGACHLAAIFLRRLFGDAIPKVFVGTPAWGNYEPLCILAGLEHIEKYRYYDHKSGQVDFDSTLSAVANAPSGSIFILQGCCHNPSGMDLSQTQWRTLAAAMQERGHLPFFDIAYQGLSGSSLDDGAFPIRLFAEMGFEMLVCQSFSKNFGLYGERCGALHVVTDSAHSAVCVKDQLRSLIRWEFSSSPAYGARLVAIVLGDETLRRHWLEELAGLRQRLQTLREHLYQNLNDLRKVPRDWSCIKETTGLFCLLPLTPEQCQELVQVHHVYLPASGRINISGLNQSNMKKVVSAIETVIKRSDAVPTQVYETGQARL